MVRRCKKYLEVVYGVDDDKKMEVVTLSFGEKKIFGFSGDKHHGGMNWEVFEENFG